MSDVIVLIGAGSIGAAIVRRVGAGRHVLVADRDGDHAGATAETLRDAGFEAAPTTVDISSRDSVAALVKQATGLGPVTGLVQAAGVSPSQASPATILRVDLYGTALVLDLFGRVIAPGGAGVVIASQSGHRLPALSAQQDEQLATAPVEELLDLPLVTAVDDPLLACQVAKRGNALRVRAQSVVWGERSARINCISPGIIITPLARDELTGPRGPGYRAMLEGCPVGRAGTPDEVANVAQLLMGPAGAFITGSDILMDGGVTASWYYGPLRPGK